MTGFKKDATLTISIYLPDGKMTGGLNLSELYDCAPSNAVFSVDLGGAEIGLIKRYIEKTENYSRAFIESAIDKCKKDVRGIIEDAIERECNLKEFQNFSVAFREQAWAMDVDKETAWEIWKEAKK